MARGRRPGSNVYAAMPMLASLVMIGGIVATYFRIAEYTKKDMPPRYKPIVGKAKPPPTPPVPPKPPEPPGPPEAGEEEEGPGPAPVGGEEEGPAPPGGEEEGAAPPGGKVGPAPPAPAPKPGSKAPAFKGKEEEEP